MNLDRERIYLPCPRCNFYARPLARQYGSPPTRQPDAFAISTGGSPPVPKRVWTAGKPTNTIPPHDGLQQVHYEVRDAQRKEDDEKKRLEGKKPPCLEMDCHEAKTRRKPY